MSEFMVVLSAALLIPYFAWGLYTLRVRYRFHEELTVRTEAATLAAVAVILALELLLLRKSMTDLPVLFTFTALGLVVSATALYGPMLVSLASQLLVDMIIPAHPEDSDVPSFAPAEALERVGDHEGAVQEYLVMARIFPRDGATALRIGDNLAKLEKWEEAAEWFERGLSWVDDPERCLLVVNRLAEIHLRRLEQPGDATRILQLYIDRYPELDRTNSVRARLAKIEESQARKEKAEAMGSQGPSSGGLLE